MTGNVQRKSEKNPHSSEQTAIAAQAAIVPAKSCAAAESITETRVMSTGAVKLSAEKMLIMQIIRIISLSVSLFILHRL